MPARAFGGIVPHRAAAGQGLSFFDRVAEAAARFAGAPLFFVGCCVGVILWAFLGPAAGYSDSWQLVINTTTTIITFLLVALFQNSARRSDRAIHHKLDAIADALADFMARSPYGLEKDIEELKEAVGLGEEADKK